MIMDWNNPVPKEVSGLDLSFGPKHLSEFIPPVSVIPESLMNLGRENHWMNFVSGWFYKGISNEDVDALVPTNGIDKMVALGHIRAILISMQPSHEHKIGGCAYLMDKWFKGPK